VASTSSAPLEGILMTGDRPGPVVCVSRVCRGGGGNDCRLAKRLTALRCDQTKIELLISTCGVNFPLKGCKCYRLETFVHIHSLVIEANVLFSGAVALVLASQSMASVLHISDSRELGRHSHQFYKCYMFVAEVRADHSIVYPHQRQSQTVLHRCHIIPTNP
jgi:hypothetical protein